MRNGSKHHGRLTALAACSVALATIVAGCGSSSSAPPAAGSAQTATTAASGLRGLVPTPFPVKPDFTLRDTAGKSYDFRASTRGKLTYLFFGYTHCPDACPAAMSDVSYALRLQSAAVRKQVAVVFVTVDPRRDTGPVLRKWLNHYGTSFVGLTGTDPQIAAVERQAGIPPAPPSLKGRSASYQVSHSSFLFAFSPDDRAHVVYATGFKPDDYAHDLPLLLKFRG
jgi:protein SCO1